MSTQVTHSEYVQIAKGSQSLSMMERYVLRRAHPRSAFIDVAGVMWFTYFFWHHDWVAALGAVLISRILAWTAVWKADTYSMSETVLGKIALLHLQPVNLMLQTVGAFGTIYGIWQHSTEFILAGFSVILLGHLCGWSKVDARFGNEEESKG